MPLHRVGDASAVHGIWMNQEGQSLPTSSSRPAVPDLRKRGLALETMLGAVVGAWFGFWGVLALGIVSLLFGGWHAPPDAELPWLLEKANILFAHPVLAFGGATLLGAAAGAWWLRRIGLRPVWIADSDTD